MAYEVSKVTKGHLDYLTYNHNKLVEIGIKMKKDYRCAVLSPSTVKTIRRLRLNRQGHRGRRRKNPHWRHRGVNQNMLVSVPITKKIPLKNKDNTHIRMSLLNVQSIHGKDGSIVEYFLSNNISMAIITESWLQNSEEDACRLSTSEFYTCLFSAVPSNRQDRKGGGILLVHKKSYKVNLIEEVFTHSFQAAKFRIQIDNCNVNLLSIYHPPYSTVNPVTDRMFIDDFTKWICDQLVMSDHDNKLIILGDINIHVNDESDENAHNFMDIIMALGLDQHVNFPTHKAGNTLDLVMTELGSKLEVTRCSPGPFWSDHCAEDFVVKLPTVSSVQEADTINVRKLSELDYDRFIEDVHIGNLLSISDLSELVNKMEKNIQNALDIQDPLKKKQLPIRTRVPWYTNEPKQQKQTVRKREQIWRKYRAEHQWIALKEERKKYTAMIRRAKTHMLSSQVIEAGKDTKKLFRFIDKMTGKNKSNPLPPSRNNEELAEEFASFFINKIRKIREALDTSPKFKPTQQSSSKSFVNFTNLTEDEVEKIIMSILTKSCKLDVLPTKVLKDIVTPLLPLLTKIINLSLTEGMFAEECKVAIIHPLLKKPGLDHICRNYRPVSNLPFLSKVVEKAALKQFIKHCNENSLLPNYQSAYRKHYSCKTALVKLFDDLLWSMEKQKVNLLVAINLSATFDMVDHGILIDVLNTAFNVGGKSLDWFKSYLYPMSCKINIGESFF